jgi:predicted membrane-bound spermidine synthase
MAANTENSVDKIITAYVKLITVMIGNEINLISRLTQSADNDESAGIVNRLIDAMNLW